MNTFDFSYDGLFPELLQMLTRVGIENQAFLPKAIANKLVFMFCVIVTVNLQKSVLHLSDLVSFLSPLKSINLTII